MRMQLTTALFIAMALFAVGCSQSRTDKTPSTPNESPTVFDAGHEADRLAAFWGESATTREMIAGVDAVAFEVNVATDGRPLTTRFMEQRKNEINFFTGSANDEDIKRMREYLEERFPSAEWETALGHLFDGKEEQWRIFP